MDIRTDIQTDIWTDGQTLLERCEEEKRRKKEERESELRFATCGACASNKPVK